MDTYHVPVLGQELMAGLAVRAGGHYLDATLGGGGHTSLILAAAPDVTVVAIDRDEQAIRFCQARFANSPVEFWHGNFAEYQSSEAEFDGIIADLGVSSAQFDTPERGFSFRHPAQLDMRMNQQQSLTAQEIINHWEEVKLADIIYKYGEERLSRRIARRIVQGRPFQTTTELAGAIASSFPPKQRNGRIHPATRTFQALRIAVNSELASLETFLNQAPRWLKPGGRIGIITFHSLEDRPVKHQLRGTPSLQVLTKKPIGPQSEEVARNPRSRSAKLRLAERIT
ncbi:MULTISPECIES: 16S rRNA (cytosine(1402)-N(4))-methyltransferase RsmH [unclassified Microcoleus]|uniref:16S rRNA (cytosine(1402)-N(4))-methyltransferase RsmH n=1 Tax=unclassified Microcoleus TaxID=2642155 RepID=UPI002FD2A8AB